MTIRVVDSSIVSASVFPGQYLAAAQRFLVESRGTLVAPEFLLHEVANAAWQLRKRQRITREQVTRSFIEFERLGLEIVDSRHWALRAFALAEQFTLPAVYDAIYLACAEDLDAELWTCDRRFVASFGPERPEQLKLCPDDLPPGR